MKTIPCSRPKQRQRELDGLERFGTDHGVA
jgi:hypothetical protein